jgi:hypothetical protein
MFTSPFPPSNVTGESPLVLSFPNPGTYFFTLTQISKRRAPFSGVVHVLAPTSTTGDINFQSSTVESQSDNEREGQGKGKGKGKASKTGKDSRKGKFRDSKLSIGNILTENKIGMLAIALGFIVVAAVVVTKVSKGGSPERWPLLSKENRNTAMYTA